MKVQYFGDVNDFRKFALLRALSKGGLKIGVVWMMTPNDDRSDGGNRAYLTQAERWRAHDPQLFDALKGVPFKSTPEDLLRVEREGLVPGAVFFNDLTPVARADRVRWHVKAVSAMSDVDLAFFDPDNGLSVKSAPKGQKNSNKFVFEDELAEHFAAGRSILIYQHYPRIPRDVLINDCVSRIRRVVGDAAMWSFPTPHSAFLLAAQLRHIAMVDATLAGGTWPTTILPVVSHS